jgi:glycine betaine/proline transport system substrate-binding protein
MKSIMKALGAAAMLGLSMLPAHAQEKTIKLGTMAWEDLLPITGVAKKVLEDKGYTVEVTEFAEWGIAYAALTRGDAQVLISQVDYVAHDYWDKNKSRLEKVSVISHGLFQALAVPSYVEINSMEELNANAEMFGGKIIGIEPGAGMMREAADGMEEYGLDDLELVEGSTAGMTAALKAAVDRKEPIVVALWDPTWMFEKFDMKFLEDPKHVFSPPTSYNVIAQKGFSEENPEAREILAGIFMPIDQVRAINTAVSDGKTMDQAIADWITANEGLIERWEVMKNY